MVLDPKLCFIKHILAPKLHQFVEQTSAVFPNFTRPRGNEGLKEHVHRSIEQQPANNPAINMLSPVNLPERHLHIPSLPTKRSLTFHDIDLS